MGLPDFALERYFDQYEFSAHPGIFNRHRPKAGPIAFPGLKWDGGADAFCADLVKAKGVLLLPVSLYGFGNRHFRLGFGRRNMPQALEKLGEYLREKGAPRG